MPDSEESPLLATRDFDHDSQPQSGNESTPLLSGGDVPRYDGDENRTQQGDNSASPRSRRSSTSSKSASKQRWPSIIAMVILAILSVTIMIAAFFAPAAIEEYAKQAAVLEPTNLSLESITTDGVRARIKANFRLDGSKVENTQVRRVGSVATWFVRELGTEATRVNVYLPEYDNILLGSTEIPPITLKIDGQNTVIDLVAELVPGAAEGIRMIANEWLEGRLNQLRVMGEADIKLKTGIIPLGTHTVSESLTLEASKLPGGEDGSVPPYNITRLFFRDVDNHTVGADVSVSMYNKWPIELNIPPLAFEVLLANCGLHDPYIQVADAVTETVIIRPHSNVVANVHGVVGKLPESLTRLCPDSGSTPLDRLLKQYLGGEAPPVYVRGKRHPTGGTPEWLNEILSQVVVPVPFPERSFDNLIRNFSLTETHFSLPDPTAEPGDPDANPKVSGTIQAIANLPQEMNFGINVTHIRASADVLYKDQKLGILDLRKWQAANSTKVESSNGHGLDLMIRSRIIDAPLNVTDADVFTDVIQQLIFKGKTIHLEIKALVDVEIETVLGELVLKNIPAEGMIPVKPILNGGSSKHNLLARLKPEVGFIKILETTPSSIRLEALVNITNPTAYTASIPYISAHILCNGSTLGEVTAENMDITTGNNSYLVVQAKWEPSAGGARAKVVGREFLSQYLSGFNTTLAVRAHRDSIPGQPLLGDALSHFNLTIPAPRLRLPGDDGNEPGSDPPARTGHFIRNAVFHLLSSSAQFTLASPLQYNTVYIEHINATAFYNHTEPIGQIIYDLPIAATPGLSQTPRLPVDWTVGSIGREKLRKALGGALKLDAIATVGVRIGEWREKIWYVGKGIGASVRL